MRAIPCPVSKAELEQLYLGEKLTDDEVAARIGKEATAKRVRSWRKRLGIRTLQRWERHDVPAIEGRLRSLLVGSMLGDGRLVRGLGWKDGWAQSCSSEVEPHVRVRCRPRRERVS